LNFGHFSKICKISFPLHFHLISHSPIHLPPLTLSLTHSRPSGRRGVTSPTHICKKALHFHHNTNPFTRIPNYKILYICKFPSFSHFFIKRASSSSRTLASRDHPNPFTSTSRSQEIQPLLHQGNTKWRFFNPSFIKVWIEALTTSILESRL